MSIVAAPVLLLTIVLPLLALAVGVALLAARRTPVPSEAAAAARRHAAVVSTLAWVVALLSPVALVPLVRVAGSGGLTAGVLTGLLPTVTGLLFLAVHTIGESTWPRPTGTVRRAPLTPRTVADLAPRGLRRLVRAWAATLVVTLVVSGLVADGGRAITRAWEQGSTTASPFPGWYYGVPLLVATGVVVAASEGVLRLIARRPAVMDAQPEWDLGLRRLSAHRVLRGTQLVLGLTTAGVLLVAGTAVRSVARSGAAGTFPPGSPGLAVVGVAVALLGAVAGLACVLIALVPGQPARMPAPADPGRTTWVATAPGAVRSVDAATTTTTP